jgi:hypothetical protein
MAKKLETHIAILDYSTNSVIVTTAAIKNDTESVEEYLIKEGYKLSEVNYMTSKEGFYVELG